MPISPPSDASVAVAEPQEVLYTNEGGTALTKASGTSTWGNSLDFELSRALTDNDDGKTLRLDLSWTSSNLEHHFRVNLAETFFHHLEAWTATSGNALPSDFVTFVNIRTRSQDTTLNSTDNRLWIVARNRASNGNDIFRLQICDSSSQVAWTNVFATISLVP